jgi:phosphoglycerate dehydrogenase-like enzyme
MEIVAYDQHLPVPSGGPLLGRTRLEAMKPGSCVINTARGGLVDEGALAESLHSGHIVAAGIDVFLPVHPIDPTRENERSLRA